MSKLQRITYQRNRAEIDPAVFEVALFAYFGLSNKAMRNHLNLSDLEINKFLHIARKHGLAVYRRDYRDGKSLLAQHVVKNLRPMAEKNLQIEYNKA